MVDASGAGYDAGFAEGYRVGAEANQRALMPRIEALIAERDRLTCERDTFARRLDRLDARFEEMVERRAALDEVVRISEGLGLYDEAQAKEDA